MGELAATDRRDEGSPISESGRTTIHRGLRLCRHNGGVYKHFGPRLSHLCTRPSSQSPQRRPHCAKSSLGFRPPRENRDNTTVIALSDRTSDSLGILGRSANCGEGDKIGRCLRSSTTNLGNDEASKRNEHYTEHHHDKR